MARSKPKTRPKKTRSTKPVRASVKRPARTRRPVEPRTPALVTALVGVAFSVATAACVLGAYQLFRDADSHPPYRSVVLMPSHTPKPTPYPPGWRQVSEWSVPILMYHHIRPVPETWDQIARGLSVSPESFARQLDYLAAKGYTPITFTQLRQGVLPPKPVILTFDDGSDDAYTAAFPALRDHGLAGVFYVISGSVDQSDSVTWDQLREMQRAGMEIGAHTVSHPDLATLSEEEQQQQINGSIVAIQEALGQPVIAFAYPSGKSNSDTVKLVGVAGIVYSVTTEPGTAASTDDPQLLPRYRITDTTDLSGVLP